MNDLKNAVSLAEKCFQPSAICLEEDIDPEIDDTRIRITWTVHNKSRQEVLAAYRDYQRQLINNFPGDKSMFIRLTYDIS